MNKKKSGLKDETRELLLADFSLREPPAGVVPEACVLRDAVLQALEPVRSPEQETFLLDDALLRKKTAAVPENRRVSVRLLAAAASIVLLLGIGVLWKSDLFSPSASFKVAETHGGAVLLQGKRIVSVAQGGALAAPFTIRQSPAGTMDLTAAGTTIRLFGETELSVDAFSGSRAGITLRQGTAAFMVSRDCFHQYTVRCGGILVQVTGTQFALSRVGETALVGVKTGMVRVEIEGKKPSVHSLSSGNGVLFESGTVAFCRDFRREPVFQALVRQLDRIDHPLSRGVPGNNPGIPEVAERIHFRDGGVLTGRVVALDARRVVVETPSGMAIFSADRVVRIEYR